MFGAHARYTDRISVCSPWPKGLGNPLNPGRARDRELQLFPLNEEFPVSVGEPAEGSLSKRTEAPARVAAASPGNRAASRACRGQDAPVEALDKAQVFSRASSTLAVSSDGHIEHRRSERELRPRVNPGTTPASGSSEKHPGAPVAGRMRSRTETLCLRRPVEVSKGPARDRIARRRRIDLEEVFSFRQVAAIDRERRRSSARVTSLTFRPEVGRDYPLNLSILLSGGKETNEDSLKRVKKYVKPSRGKREGLSGRPALSAVAGLIAADLRTLTGRIPPVHGRGQRTSAGREPRDRLDGGQKAARKVTLLRASAIGARSYDPPSGRGEIAASGAFGCPGACAERGVGRPGTVLSARLSELCCGVGSSREAHGVRGLCQPPSRPVLKHGPRSLTCARAAGLYRNPQGVVKANAGVVRRR
ncbi:unnamed protein product [Clavelina lepadiformis]|uniref:Uncharacterized protein n=1 Tax=Clavelina lepadiformis TaxID=159417 RepID=A0ABP0GNY6_CLALP